MIDHLKDLVNKRVQTIVTNYVRPSSVGVLRSPNTDEYTIEVLNLDYVPVIVRTFQQSEVVRVDLLLEDFVDGFVFVQAMG